MQKIQINPPGKVNLEQLDEEIRQALGLAQRPGLALSEVEREDGTTQFLLLLEDGLDAGVAQKVAKEHVYTVPEFEGAKGRMKELKAKGFGGLTASERQEMLQHVLTLLGT